MAEEKKPAFMSISKIQMILDCSYTKAQNIAHAMIMEGNGFQDKGLIRVKVDAFEQKYNVKVA